MPGAQLIRQVVHIEDNEDKGIKIQLALDVIFQGKSVVFDFVNKDSICLLLVEVDPGVAADLRMFGFKVTDLPKMGGI